MDSLVRQGKVLYWGTSEWSADEIRAAYGLARQFNLEPPVMEQPQYNLFERDKIEREYSRLFEDEGLGTTIWSPLASGILTGKYNQGIPVGSRMEFPQLSFLKEKLESKEGISMIKKTEKLAALADKLGISLVHLSLAWCLKNPDVSTVILGASNVDQLKENLKTLEFVDYLTSDVLDQIELIVDNSPEKWLEF